jgi:hypothetical protein
LKELKSSRNTRLKLPLLDEDFDDELDEDLELDDKDLDEDREDRMEDREEEIDEEREDELRDVEDTTALLLAPLTVKAAMPGVPDPLAQKPKLTLLLAATDLFHETGVTRFPLRLPFHKLVIWVPAVFSVIVQLVILVLPALISTCAQ